MSCTKNLKKFLFINYKGEHNFIRKNLRVFIPGSKQFIIDSECSLCKLPHTEHFVTWEDMLEMGYTIEQCMHWQYIPHWNSINLQTINKDYPYGHIE